MILDWIKSALDPYSHWVDHPCEHAARGEITRVNISSFTRPIDDGPLFNGSARNKKLLVPSNYEFLTGKEEPKGPTRDVSIKERGGSTQYTLVKCPTYRCPECGEVFRGPWYEVDTQTVWKGEEQPKRAVPISHSRGGR